MHDPYLYDIKLRQGKQCKFTSLRFFSKSKAELVSYVTNQTNRWIEIRGGKLAGDGGGEIKQLIHSESWKVSKKK